MLNKCVFVGRTRVRGIRRICQDPEGRTCSGYECVKSIGTLHFAHVFEKYADLPKAQHAVSWRAKVAYYSKKSDGCGYVKPVSTFVCTRVREIRRFR